MIDAPPPVTDALTRLKARIEYPSDKDFASLLYLKIIPTLFYSAMFALASTQFHEESDQVIQDCLQILAIVLGTLGLAGGGLCMYQLQRWSASQVRFSDTPLSVNRVAPHPSGQESALFPVLANQSVIGELHFMPGSQYEDASNLELTTLGFLGLYRLATALEHDHHRFAGIEYFYGISLIVDKKFTRFGFQTVPATYLQNRLEQTDPILETIALLYALPGLAYYLAKVHIFLRAHQELSGREPRAALITREALIKNKLTYRRLSGRHPSHHKQ